MRFLRPLSALLLSIFLAAAFAQPSTSEAAAGTAASRAGLLHRGVNASMWFAQAQDYSPARLRSYTTDDDIALMHTMGFDHVRLSVDAEELLRNAPPDGLNNVFVAELDRAVDAILRNQLRVIIDIHPTDAYKENLRTRERAVIRFVSMWGALAAHFGKSDPERVLFEIMNEPEFSDGAQWSAVEVQAVEAIRQAAPRHTIIASAPNYSGLTDLLTVEPLADSNIIYTFHDYEPFAFTHQGATWTMERVRPLHGVPYPSSPETIAPLLKLEPRLIDQHWLESYGLDRWDAARIRTELDFAAQWGAMHHVPVYCGEFGVYRNFAQPAMRAAWLRDTRLGLESAGIGWAVWDYQGGFAVVEKRDGKSAPDPAVAAALGLQPQ